MRKNLFRFRLKFGRKLCHVYSWKRHGNANPSAKLGPLHGPHAGTRAPGHQHPGPEAVSRDGNRRCRRFVFFCEIKSNKK